MTHRIQELMTESSAPVLMDGAMGTMLLADGLPAGAAAEAWCVTRPDVVGWIHRAYRDAGARVLVTNTFGAHPPLLAARGCRIAMGQVVQAAVRLARQAGGEEGAAVLGDVGPALAPGEGPGPGRMEALRPLVAALAGEGVDGLLFESLRDPRDLDAALEAHAREAAALPAIVSATFLAPQVADALCEAELAARARRAAALGVNCTELARMPALVRALAAAGVPLCVRPSGGLPGAALAPAKWARGAASLALAGGSLLGGCCGTTPAHIAALARLL